MLWYHYPSKVDNNLLEAVEIPNYLPNLKLLSLKNNALKAFDLSKKKLPSLERLDLSGNSLTSMEIPISLPKLLELDVSTTLLIAGCNIELSVLSFKPSITLPLLEKIYLSTVSIKM